jgi:hypothetical protein
MSSKIYHDGMAEMEKVDVLAMHQNRLLSFSPQSIDLENQGIMETPAGVVSECLSDQEYDWPVLGKKPPPIYRAEDDVPGNFAGETTIKVLNMDIARNGMQLTQC